jgi:uracil-DNA glycosylase
MEESWKKVLQEEWKKPYLKELSSFLMKERSEKCVFPPQDEVFQAFETTPFEKVKVVVVGQDPYHGAGQAHGLSFSVKKGVKMPPSLKNIFKELEDDLGVKAPDHGCLQGWAEQGVLMLNNVLTVCQGEPGSHRGKGWELFTDQVVHILVERADPVIFVLWGKDAQEKCKSVKEPHHVLVSPHPSPYSAHSGFFGSRPFSKINELLTKQGKDPIKWSLS